MSTSSINNYQNRISIGELNVNSGTLGQYVNNNSIISIISAPFYDGYVMVNTTTATIQLPVIGTATTQVQKGWKTTFIIQNTTSATSVTFVDSSLSTITMINSTGWVLAAQVIVITFTALSEPNGWDYIMGFPMSQTGTTPPVASSIFYSNITNSPVMSFASMYGRNRRAIPSIAANNVNVLYATPTTITFTLPSNDYDKTFYNIPSPYTAINFLVSGIYMFEVFIIIVNAGGGTSANVQTSINKNGVALPGAMDSTSATLAASNTYPYVLRVIGQVSAGDVITFVGGKSIVSLGTSLLSGFMNIKYIG